MATRRQTLTRAKGIVAILAGGGMLLVLAYMALQTLPVMMFHPVPGMVVAKRLHRVDPGRVNFYKPVIEYSYVVQGIPYRNDVFNIVDNDGTEGWSRWVLQKYHVGGVCTVYYDPLNPETSALSQRPTSETISLMLGLAILGSLSVASGISMLLGARWGAGIRRQGQVG